MTKVGGPLFTRSKRWLAHEVGGLPDERGKDILKSEDRVQALFLSFLPAVRH